MTDVPDREREIVRHSGALEFIARFALSEHLSGSAFWGAVMHNCLWRASCFIGKYGALFGHSSAFSGRMLGILGAALYIL